MYSQARTQLWHLPSSGVGGSEDMHHCCQMVAPLRCVQREAPHLQAFNFLVDTFPEVKVHVSRVPGALCPS